MSSIKKVDPDKKKGKRMRKTVWRAFRDTIPLGIGVVLYGLVYGMMGRQEGIPFWFVLGMSLLVFAGSSQMGGAGAGLLRGRTADHHVYHPGGQSCGTWSWARTCPDI